jgi:hypothetical protein
LRKKKKGEEIGVDERRGEERREGRKETRRR